MAAYAKTFRHRRNKPEYFHEKYIKTNSGCWEWIGRGDEKGYGRFCIDKKVHLAHRYSWSLHNGHISNDLFVCHHCDNPPCVNPDHLFIGSNLDNINDAVIKGRKKGIGGSKKGRKLPKWKLEDKEKLRKYSKDTRNLIRAMKLLGCTYDHIYKKTGVKIGAAFKMVRSND